MTDDWIARTNETTRSAIAALVNGGLEGAEIAKAIETLPEFEQAKVELIAAISPLPDPMAELGKAVLALASREPVINVTVQPADPVTPSVTVNIPEAPIPVVNVKASLPSELRIVSMPERVTAREIERDKKGVITRTLDVESDR